MKTRANKDTADIYEGLVSSALERLRWIECWEKVLGKIRRSRPCSGQWIAFDSQDGLTLHDCILDGNHDGPHECACYHCGICAGCLQGAPEVKSRDLQIQG